jgi:hydrogenase expression/formation protein HypC
VCLAVPGRITNITEGADPALRTGRVDFGGVAREVSLAFVPEAAVGDYVIVHVGFAISLLDEEEAKQTLADLAALEEIAAREGGRPVSK